MFALWISLAEEQKITIMRIYEDNKKLWLGYVGITSTTPMITDSYVVGRMIKE